MILLIDNKRYTEQDFNALLADFPDESSWQYQIGLFLSNWLDNKTYIEVKTSGSTGVPKVIRMSKQTMLASASMTNHFFGLSSESTALLCLPASYIAGKMMIVRAIIGGYTLTAVAPSANPFSHLTQKIDFSAITPYQLVQSATSLQNANICKIIVGGSPVTPAMEKMSASWKVALYETFGMTETASHIALRRFNGSGYSPYFQVLPGVKISQDERNCLIIKAPHLTEELLVTNDIVSLQGRDYFQWLGRFDRVINTGGIKVFPEQIEKKIQESITHPFFIASVPDLSLGQKVILVLEHEEMSVNEQEHFIASLSTYLNKYEVPKEIYFLKHFVYSSSGKVLRLDTLQLLALYS